MQVWSKAFSATATAPGCSPCQRSPGRSWGSSRPRSGSRPDGRAPPRAFAHSDDRHFQDPALIGAPEGGMGLHTAAQDDPIRLVCVVVHKDGHSLLGLAHLDHLHEERGWDSPEIPLSPHSRGGSPAGPPQWLPVAAHGREHKGLSPQDFTKSTMARVMMAILATPGSRR